MILKATLFIRPKRTGDSLKCKEITDTDNGNKRTYLVTLGSGKELDLTEEEFNELFEVTVRAYTYDKD